MQWKNLKSTGRRPWETTFFPEGLSDRCPSVMGTSREIVYLFHKLQPELNSSSCHARCGDLSGIASESQEAGGPGLGMGMAMVSSIPNSLAQWCCVAGVGRTDLWKEHAWGSAASAPILRQHHLSFSGVLLLVLLLWQNARQKQLKEGRVCLACSSRGSSILMGKLCDRTPRQLVMWLAQSWCREQWVLLLSLLSVLYSIQDPSQSNVIADIQVGSCVG